LDSGSGVSLQMKDSTSAHLTYRQYEIDLWIVIYIRWSVLSYLNKHAYYVSRLISIWGYFHHSRAQFIPRSYRVSKFSVAL